MTTIKQEFEAEIAAVQKMFDAAEEAQDRLYDRVLAVAPSMFRFSHIAGLNPRARGLCVERKDPYDGLYEPPVMIPWDVLEGKRTWQDVLDEQNRLKEAARAAEREAAERAELARLMAIYVRPVE